MIFLFRIVANNVISFSEKVYAFVRTNPIYLPLLILGAVVIGILAALLLKVEPSCQGGGIPTSIAILRGLITFRWLRNIFTLFFSAMLTYLVGVPLGNEGPSVQIGTALGRGSIRMLTRKESAWDRYTMTGGACAGFAAATGAPVSGIFFALEEAHRRLSPMIILSAATTVCFCQVTTNALCSLFEISSKPFAVILTATLSMRFIWVALIVGIICAIFAVIFTKAHAKIFKLFDEKISSVPLWIKIGLIFGLVAIIGFFSADILGTGHHVVENMLERKGIWYLILITLFAKAILLLISNNAGITGGLFLPSLAFGAMLGALSAEGLIAINLIPEEYYPVLVVIGIASFLSASSRTPLTAIVFSIEAFGALSNVLSIVIGVTVAYLAIELLGVHSFTETLVEIKAYKANKDKHASVENVQYTVQPDAFVVGREIRDLLLPPTCVVLSVKRVKETHTQTIAAGDILSLHYKTYDNEHTTRLLEALFGAQEKTTKLDHFSEEEDDLIPDL